MEFQVSTPTLPLRADVIPSPNCPKPQSPCAPTLIQASGGENWALRAKAVMDRMRTALGDLGGACMGKLQGTAEALGGRLGVDGGVVSVFSEEVSWGERRGHTEG